MTISVFFSISNFTLASNELERSIKAPRPIISQLLDGVVDDGFRRQFERERIIEVNETEDRLVARLILINLAIFVFGGVASYYLARWSLRPIQESHEALERFTSDASHELRTPLTAMKTDLEVTLHNDKMSTDDARRSMESAIEEIDVLTKLSESLLRMSRIDNSSGGLEAVPAREILDIVSGRIQSKPRFNFVKVQSNKDIKPDVKIFADKDLIVEALLALLDNSVKYNKDNQQIILRAELDYSQNVRFKIVDKGVGIPEDDLPYVFDRFYRADSARTDSSVNGFGLGLSLVKEIAELHSGEVLVESQLGKGTVAYLIVPKHK